MHIRLDTFLAGLGLVPRRQAARLLKSWIVLVDGVEALRGDIKIAYGQTVSFGGMDIEVKKNVYVALYKTAGYVCSELDEGGHLSYKNLLEDCPYAASMHIAGRLDQDTEGLVLCSDDGQRTHQIISPKKLLEKEYFVRVRDALTPEAMEALRKGVQFIPGYPGGGRDDGYVTMPAQAYWVDVNGVICDVSHETCDPCALRLVIVEGKFHQVKRMLQSVGNEVTYLRRDRIGSWKLDWIEVGKWRYIDPC